MNKNFTLFNVLPLVIGWIGIKYGINWLTIIATTVIVSRSIMSLILSAKLHSSLSHLSETVRSRYRAVLRNPQLTFSVAIINMISLALWGQEESLIILAIATGAYFSVRHQLLRKA